MLEREKNRDPVACPHNAYPCKGDDQWVALSCWSDAEFRPCPRPRQEWAADKRFKTAAARRKNLKALDKTIAAWTRTLTVEAVVETLQAVGIRAHNVNTCADLFTDPQLLHRKTWRVRKHPEIDYQAHYFPGFDLSEQPGDVTAPAPVIGQDNEIVFREYLGLPAEEYQKLKDNGVI